MAIAWMIWKSSGQKIQKKLLLVWWFNPINLYVTYMMGQVDIVIAFFLVAAVLLVNKNNLAALVSVVVALMAKTYVLAVVPALYLIKQTYKQVVVLTMVSAAIVFDNLSFC